MPPAQPSAKTRTIIAREVKEISKGRTKTGREYTMWQIVATLESGQPIAQNLRSFEELPTNVPIEVKVTPFISEQFGTSYTLELTGDSKKEHGLRATVERLEARIATLEATVERLVTSSPPPTTLPAVPNGDTPPPPGPDPSSSAPPDDEIPF